MEFIRNNKRILAIIYVLLAHLAILLFPKEHFYNNSSAYQYFLLIGGVLLPFLFFTYAFDKMASVSFLLLIALTFFSYTYSLKRRNQELIKHAVNVESVISEVDYYRQSRGRRRGSRSKEKAVAYLLVEGKKIKVTKRFDRGEGYKIGDSVLIIYSKKYPHNNKILGLLEKE